MGNMGKMEHMNMPKDSGTSTGTTGSQASVLYTCSMHPQVVKTEPGNCPICGMTLVPKNSNGLKIWGDCR